MRKIGLCEIHTPRHDTLNAVLESIRSRIKTQQLVVNEIEQVIEKKNKKSLIYEAMTKSQFYNLSFQIEREKDFLKLLNRYQIVLSSSLNKKKKKKNEGEEEKEEGKNGCSHQYLELWRMPKREFHCGECKKRIEDPERLKLEESWIEKVHLEDKDFFVKNSDDDDEDVEENGLSAYHSAKMKTFEVDDDKSAGAAIMRGVTIKWLIDWTNQKKCWNMPTWEVKVKFIVPETSKSRCRYSELESSRQSGAFGKAETFVSHCWGAKCTFLSLSLACSLFLSAVYLSYVQKQLIDQTITGGLMVAALADHADLNRRVWIDVFTVCSKYISTHTQTNKHTYTHKSLGTTMARK